MVISGGLSAAALPKALIDDISGQVLFIGAIEQAIDARQEHRTAD